MMDEQRRLEEVKPPDQRIQVGGEAHAIYLTNAACTFECLFQFSDFKTHASQILRSFAEGGPEKQT